MKSGIPNLQEPDLADPEWIEPIKPLAYVKIRLTLDDEIVTPETLKKMHSPARLSRRAEPYVTKMINDHAKQRGLYTAVVEILDKLGNYTRPHLHLHFVSTKKDDTIRTSLKREYFAQNDEILKGNNLYSMKFETFIDDDRFYRYPLKQLETLDTPLNLTPPRQGLDVLRQVALAQWKLGCEINQSKKTKQEPSPDLYQRMCCKIEKPEKPTTKYSVALGMLEFYLNENRPINNQTIQGYIKTYCLQNGIISKEDFVKSLIKNI